MSFIKYPKIRQLGHKENKNIFFNQDDTIVIEEKIDGANFRFMIDGKKFIFGSRTRELTKDLQEQKNWKYCCDYLKETVKPHKKYEGLIFFGEVCTKHTINYDFAKMPPFLGFDIYDTFIGKFIDAIEAQKIFEEIGLKFVPIIDIKKAKDIAKVNDDSVPKSKYYDGFAEGVVFKNYNIQLFAKHVRDRFKEDNKKAFGGTPNYEETHSGMLMSRYCTNARIEKIIHKLKDEYGYALEMELMKYLPKSVYEDIIEEEGKEMLLGNYILNCRAMRKIVSKRCAYVLKQMITNNTLYSKGET